LTAANRFFHLFLAVGITTAPAGWADSHISTLQLQTPGQTGSFEQLQVQPGQTTTQLQLDNGGQAGFVDLNAGTDQIIQQMMAGQQIRPGAIGQDFAVSDALIAADTLRAVGAGGQALNLFQVLKLETTGPQKAAASAGIARINEDLLTPQSRDIAWAEWNEAAALEPALAEDVFRFEAMYDGYALPQADRQAFTRALAGSDSPLAPYAKYDLLFRQSGFEQAVQIELWRNGSSTERMLAGDALRKLGRPQESFQLYEDSFTAAGPLTFETSGLGVGMALAVREDPSIFSAEQQQLALAARDEAAAAGNGDAIALQALDLPDRTQRFARALDAQTYGASGDLTGELISAIGPCRLENSDFLECRTVDLAFVTNRAPKGDGFGTKMGDGLKHGFSKVVVPGRSDESASDPSFFDWVALTLFGDHTPEVGAPIYRRIDVDRAAFLAELKQRADAEFGGRVTIFVHGFNNTMDIAVQRMALLLDHDDAKGLPLIYSWPSAGEATWAWEGVIPRKAYPLDLERATRSCGHARDLVGDVIAVFGSENVTLMGHSMGTFVLFSALQNCLDGSAALPDASYEAVIFAAPDIDRSDFSAKSDWAAGLSRAFNIYMMRQDVALQISDGIHDGPRLGQGGQGRFTDGRMTIVDASELEERASTNHAYVFEIGEAVEDVRTVLAGRPDPHGRRCLEAHETDPFFYLNELRDCRSF